MTQVWLYSILSVLLVSVISLLGGLTLVFKRNYLKSFLLFMVSFAAGALLGDVFIHLLPELIAEGGFTFMTGLYIILGILIFFILEKVMHWRHCHLSAEDQKDHAHPLAVMNLVGDFMHNFIDGILIAGSFLLSVPVGIATTIAVIFHEIPQEMGDFGVLLHSGMKPKKALLFNFASALSALLGVLLVLGLGFNAEATVAFIIPITIGGFLYIANTDLIPELHKEVKPFNSFIQLLSFILGVGIMALLLLLPGHAHESEGPHEPLGNQLHVEDHDLELNHDH